ncbi:MAG: hypothetical protein WC637_12310 [Victivallales bacterium]|jgi:hypothetical protein
MNCGNMVYLTPPITGDKTRTELEHENRNLRLDNQRLHAEINQLQHGRKNFRGLLDMFKRETNKIFGTH